MKLKLQSIVKLFALLLVSTLFLSGCKGGEDVSVTSQCLGVLDEDYREMDIDPNAADACDAYKAATQRDCWQANILSMMYDSMGAIAVNAYKDLTRGAMSLMMVLFSVWFAWSMIKQYGTIEEEKKAGEYWTTVLQKLFICFACGYVASSTETLFFFLNNMLYPIYNAFLELASELLANAGRVASEELTLFGQPYEASQTVCSISNQVIQEETTSGFPQGANQMMQCMICNVSEKLNIGFVLALKVMGAGFILPQIIGFTILCMFSFVKLGFVFYLVEIIFRFTMMVVLLPIFIMGFAFEQTRGWIKNAIKIILSGSVYLLSVSIVVSLAIVAIVQLIKDYPGIFNAPLEHFAGLSPMFMVLLLIAFLVKKAMGVAASLSNDLVGSKITSKFAEMMAGALRIIGQGVAIVASATGLTAAIMKINKVRQITEKVKQAKERIEEVKKKIRKLSGEDDDEDEDE